MLYKGNLSAVPVTLVGLVGFFTPNSFSFRGFFLRISWFYLKAVQAGGAASPGTRTSLHVPVAEPVGPHGFLGQAQRHLQLISTNLHLPVATQPQALPRRFWSDNSTEQEAAHFQFITLFTSYIIPPWKSLSAL